MLGLALIVICVMLLLGALPTWGHSKNWGYTPASGMGFILVLLLILVLLGYLR